VRRFFEDYKILEKKEVIVSGFKGPEEALRVVQDCIDRYARTPRG